jgi:arsenite/tail-anchored protein-transporting ATPase
VAKLDFFVGKGGVGKTTIASAFAVHCAMSSWESVLLLSTDPAHSIGDVLDQALAEKPQKVALPGRGELRAWQVPAEEQFRAFVNRYKQGILSILEKGSIFRRQDIEPLLDTTLPGMAEMSALLAINQALESGAYDRVVVDTAPIGHTLRLFELPEYFSRFLDFLETAAGRDQVLAAHFGGRAEVVGQQLLADWRSMAESVTQAFRRDARLFLVTTSEKFSLQESLRASASLGHHSPPLGISALVLNRAVLGSAGCRACRARQKATHAARRLLKQRFPGVQTFLAEDTGNPVAGVRALGNFGKHVFASKPFRWKLRPPKLAEIGLRRVSWPVLDTPLSLVLGKGGVGKTTISATLAVRTRAERNVPVELCSVDPAPSLGDIFEANIGDRAKAVLGDPHLRASEMDATKLFREWASRVREMIDLATTSDRSSVHVDLWFERQLFTQLLESVPPGLDEVLAVLRILELLADGSNKVAIDMAPSGHALDLLRTPERIAAWTRLLLKTLAGHRTLAMIRDASVRIAELGKDVRDLLGVLRDGRKTRVYVVMLPEALPDRETERLMAELEKMKLPAKTLLVNRVLFAKDAGGCCRCRNARLWQLDTIVKLRRKYRGTTLYVARNLPGEIAGRKALTAFSKELWQLT